MQLHVIKNAAISFVLPVVVDCNVLTCSHLSAELESLFSSYLAKSLWGSAEWQRWHFFKADLMYNTSHFVY